MGTHFFMQSTEFIINYLNKNKFLLPYLQSVIQFFTLTSKTANFICLGEKKIFLAYKVGKIIFSPGCV